MLISENVGCTFLQKNQQSTTNEKRQPAENKPRRARGPGEHQGEGHRGGKRDALGRCCLLKRRTSQASRAFASLPGAHSSWCPPLRPPLVHSLARWAPTICPNWPHKAPPMSPPLCFFLFFVACIHYLVGVPGRIGGDTRGPQQRHFPQARKGEASRVP